ncbi:hypothetical protein, partial [Hungatella hathewayi]
WLVLLEFSGFYILFNLLFSKCVCVVLFSTATRLSYHIVSVLSTTFFIFFSAFQLTPAPDYLRAGFIIYHVQQIMSREFVPFSQTIFTDTKYAFIS